MSKALQVFKYMEEHEIRTTVIDGVPYFVGKDVASALGYSNTNDALIRHVDEEDKLTSRITMAGQGRDVIVINESGVYSLIFSSQLPTAKKFKHWVTSEVLPQIRKTGSYSVNSSPETQGLFAIDAAIRILEHNGIQGNQLTLSLDRVYKHCTGFSLLEVTGTQLIAPKQEQYLTPTDIGKVFGLKAHRVNEILACAGYQCKVAGKWQPLELGQPYAVMQDVAKAHGEGTPICQLKWYSSILDVFGELLEQDRFELA